MSVHQFSLLRWPRGITGFTRSFQNLRGEFSTAIATFNFQPRFNFSTAICYFSFQPATAIFNVLLLQLSTGDSVFQRSIVIPATFNCDCNFQLRLQLSTVIAALNCDSTFQRSTAIPISSRNSTFQHFNCDSNFQLQFAISVSVIPTALYN